AAEAAADLCRDDPDSAFFHSQQTACETLHAEMRLGRTIDRDVAVRVVVSHCIKRLDISLMSRGGRKLTLNHEICCTETGFDISTSESNMRCDIGRVIRMVELARVSAAGDPLFAQFGYQNRGIGPHRLVDG